MISYGDVAAAVDWLSRAFGFRERGERFTDDHARITNAELELDGATVMLGWPGWDFRAPPTTLPSATTQRDGSRCPGSWTASSSRLRTSMFIMGAVLAGAATLRGPEEIPIGRLYTASDREGHRWMFMQPATR
jgi:PhnB protein